MTLRLPGQRVVDRARGRVAPGSQVLQEVAPARGEPSTGLRTRVGRAPVAWISLQDDHKSRDLGRCLQGVDFDVRVLPSGWDVVGVIAAGFACHLPSPDLLVLEWHSGHGSGDGLNAVLRALCWRTRIVICLPAGTDPSAFDGTGYGILVGDSDAPRIVEMVVRLWR